jgi:ribosomal protein S18 acetylase RimI-like enzyme
MKIGHKHKATGTQKSCRKQMICTQGEKSMSLLIEPTKNNVYEIAVLIDSSWRAVYESIIADDYLNNMSVDARAAGLQARYDNGQSEFLVMRDDGVLMGACVYGKSFTEGYPDDGEVSAIYFRSDYIGKGHGHALFTEAEKRLAEKGYSHIVLDVLSSNGRALNFYSAHSYEAVKDATVRLGDIDYPLTVFRKTVRDKLWRNQNE